MATATRHSTWFGKYWSTNDCQDCFGVERRAVTAEATGIIQYQQLRLDPRGNPWKRLSNRKKPTTRYSREEVSKELTSWRIGTRATIPCSSACFVKFCAAMSSPSSRSVVVRAVLLIC